MSDVELKPCPFCGHDADLCCDNSGLDVGMGRDDPHAETWKVCCPDCGCEQKSDLTTQKRAADSWNTRAPTSFELDRQCRREIEGRQQ